MVVKLYFCRFYPSLILACKLRLARSKHLQKLSTFFREQDFNAAEFFTRVLRTRRYICADGSFTGIFLSTVGARVLYPNFSVFRALCSYAYKLWHAVMYRNARSCTGPRKFMVRTYGRSVDIPGLDLIDNLSINTKGKYTSRVILNKSTDWRGDVWPMILCAKYLQSGDSLYGSRTCIPRTVFLHSVHNFKV